MSLDKATLDWLAEREASPYPFYTCRNCEHVRPQWNEWTGYCDGYKCPIDSEESPNDYRDDGVLFDSAQSYYHKGQGLAVMCSISTMENGEKVLHVSLSRRSRLPSWEDVKRVKDAFIGPEREAYHVLPKQSDYINLMPYCLHLWSEWEG